MTLKDLQTYLKSVDVVNPSIIDSVISQIKFKNALNENADYNIDELRSYILKADVPNNNVINSVLTDIDKMDVYVDKNNKNILWIEEEGLYALPYNVPLILNELNVVQFFKDNHLYMEIIMDSNDGSEPFSMTVDENTVAQMINAEMIMSAGENCQFLKMIVSSSLNLSDSAMSIRAGLQKKLPQCSGFFLPVPNLPDMDIKFILKGKSTTGVIRKIQNFNNEFEYLYDSNENAALISNILIDKPIVTIPDTINEYPVKAISQIFMFNENLTQIVLPKFLETVNSNFLLNCTKLSSIVIKNGIKRINSESCKGCTALKDVYYEGTEAEWNQITIAGDNSVLLGATRYYYSETQPAGAGNYWHYVDNVPTKW